MKNKEKYDLRLINYYITSYYHREKFEITYYLQIDELFNGIVMTKEIICAKIASGYNDKEFVVITAWNEFREWLEQEVQEDEENRVCM